MFLGPPLLSLPESFHFLSPCIHSHSLAPICEHHSDMLHTRIFPESPCMHELSRPGGLTRTNDSISRYWSALTAFAGFRRIGWLPQFRGRINLMLRLTKSSHKGSTLTVCLRQITTPSSSCLALNRILSIWSQSTFSFHRFAWRACRLLLLFLRQLQPCARTQSSGSNGKPTTPYFASNSR
jgi:hypothetical protein